MLMATEGAWSAIIPVHPYRSGGIRRVARRAAGPAAWVLAVLLVAAGLVAIVPDAGEAAEALPVVGSPAPDFQLKDLQGKTVRLHALRGKQPVFLNFWATWCPPCRKEMPEIQAFVDAHGKEIAVIGIDVGEAKEPVQRFVQEAGYTWQFVLDEQGEVMQRYLAFAIPTSFFIDRQGIIRAKHIGPMTRSLIVQYAAMAGMRGER